MILLLLPWINQPRSHLLYPCIGKAFDVSSVPSKENGMANRHIAFIIKDQNPLMLRADDSVQHACQAMCERRVGAVLITDAARQLQGIFTGRDAAQVMARGGDAPAVKLADAMTVKPDTIAPDKRAIDALRAMSDGGYRHLPVVDGGKVVGIVSRGDFKGLELDRLEEETSLWERIC
ncbi:MAG: CBS domain-containing protein [Burkholderiales bacterium]|nr:CBS domain-containing protein [Burkholderiales bacterium]